MSNNTVVFLKDAPNSRVAQGLVCLGEAVTSDQWQRNVVSNQTQRSIVAAAIRGELLPNEISPQAWIDREMEVGKELSRCGLPMFDQKLVEKAAEMGVGIHHRFVPEFDKKGIGRRQLLGIAGKLGIKLNGGNAQSADCDGKEIPNRVGVFQFDLNELMRPTDAAHRPFNLDFDEQMDWATKQGGKGLSTVAKTLYIAVIRPWVEFGRIPYMGGSIRCQDTCDSDGSLSVGFFAGSGLSVRSWGRSRQDWDLWALPEVFQEL